MKKHFEPVDLIVAVGLCATVFSIYLMFAASDGILTTASGVTSPPPVTDEMYWVQPALGEAILQNMLLEREAARGMHHAVDRLNHALMAQHSLENSARTIPERTRSYAAMVEADHAARVQFVLGRRIVDFTSRGVRTGILSDTQSGTAYNRSMIALLRQTAGRMNTQFADVRQSLVAREIMTASQAVEDQTGRVQDQIGRAVTDVTLAERVYTDAIADAREQLAKVALAAVHTDQIGERFDQLAAADVGEGEMAVTEERTWPEIPGGFFLAASILLIGAFCAGLLWSEGRPETLGTEEPGRTGSSYRKTG